MADAPPLNGTLTRRNFLRRGLGGGLLLAAGGLGWLATRRSRFVAPPAEGLLVLSPKEYATMTALAERIVPARRGAPTVGEVGVAMRADRTLAMEDPSAQKDVKLVLGLLESAVAAFFFHGARHPFTELLPAEQDRVLEGWEHSAWTVKRTGFQALRSLVVAAYYSSPMTWRGLGYPGPGGGFARPGLNAP